MSSNEYSSHNVWITGAGSGIGRALALHYAAQGSHVVISGRTLDKLHQVRDAAASLPGQISCLPFDVTDAESVNSTSEALRAIVPHLDLAVLNAGTCEYIKKGNLDPALFRRVMDTNFFGFIHSINAALPLLKAASTKPHLAGVCSLAAFIGFPRAEAYGASKAAARYLLNSVRTDYSDLMDVTVVNPGFVTTPMTAANDFPMPFEMDAENAAQRIASALIKRPLEYNFPNRLTWVLRLAQLFNGIWYRQISKQRRTDNAAKRKTAG
ncbi:MAG: SDR family NAD(P)-dependent oxidoreductase [Pseudohongiella sp.]|nr:SDR family NAD(P)-dependent oxidoreductase [Pseudohongiella sp.]